MFGLVVLMIVFSNFVYKIWVGEQVQIPKIYSLLMGIYTISGVFVVPYVAFLNGTGKIKLQLFVGSFGALINIPLSIFFTKNWGISGLITLQIFLSIMALSVYPYQCHKIISQKAKGIWNK